MEAQSQQQPHQGVKPAQDKVSHRIDPRRGFLPDPDDDKDSQHDEAEKGPDQIGNSQEGLEEADMNTIAITIMYGKRLVFIFGYLESKSHIYGKS